MASAEVRSEPTYMLTLSRVEAETLADVLSRIGGKPYGSRRKYTTEILRALQSVNVNYNSERSMDIIQGLRFNDS